jgi:hypothetical protein
MFDYAGKQTPSQHCSAVEGVDALVRALQETGFTPPPRCGPARTVACGTGLRISVQRLLHGEADAGSTLQRLLALVARGLPVSLSPEDFGSEASAVESWQQFCEIVASALAARGQSARGIGICVHSHQIPLEAYCLIADAVLGAGPRYVFLDSLQMMAHRDARVVERAERNWTFLWRQRGRDRPVMPVYGGMVRSTCPLLSGEVAALVLPASGLHIPLDSAWLPIGLSLTKFASADGRIKWSLLSPALHRAVSLAEQLLERITWHDPQQQADARMNRRLAFCLSGLGDLVLTRGQDPADLNCLEQLAGVVDRVRREIYARSGSIAAQSGAMPALLQTSPVSGWKAGLQRDNWHRCWEAALRKSAVRHRNLLVMSPYSVLPRNAACGTGFADLLPLIALADAWSFASPAKFSGWNVAQYRHFHRHARAAIQGSQRASFIAAGV